MTCGKAVDILKAQGYDQLPVVDKTGHIHGVVTEGNLLAKITAGKISPSDPVTSVLYRQFKTVSMSTSLAKLSSIFDRDHFALVTASHKCFGDEVEEPKSRSMIVGVVSRVDLLNFIMKDKN